MFPLDKNKIVFESEGDFCDNSQALYTYMKDNSYFVQYKAIWLADDPKTLKNKEKVKAVSKDCGAINVIRSYHFATSKYYIYDHCNLLLNLKRRKKQRTIFLCHGYTGFKAPKGSAYILLDISADEVFVTGILPQQGALKYLNVSLENTYILGFSRLDWFYSDLSKAKQILDKQYGFHKYKKVFLWMPTFRKSDNNLLSETYLNDGTGLPLFTTIEKLYQFNEFFKRINSLLVLKLHHLQAEMDIFSINFSNITIIRDESLASINLQLYQFIPCTDALISDYSSVSVDYYLLNKPIIFILDDYEEYKNARGLYPENALELMKGYHIYNIEQLMGAINEISDGKDIYSQERNGILNQFHMYQNGEASKRILEHLKIEV